MIQVARAVDRARVFRQRCADDDLVTRMKDEIAKGVMDGIYDLDRQRATAETTIKEVNSSCRVGGFSVSQRTVIR